MLLMGKIFNSGINILLLTLSAHAREGYSSHFVCLLFYCGEGAVFRVETYINTF